MATILEWLKLFEPTPEKLKTTKKGKEKEPDNDDYDFERVALKIIDDLAITLNDLRVELGKKQEVHHNTRAQE